MKGKVLKSTKHKQILIHNHAYKLKVKFKNINKVISNRNHRNICMPKLHIASFNRAT